jgi:DNA invertase Pin-like site-specific DNA recombinase/transposase
LDAQIITDSPAEQILACFSDAADQTLDVPSEQYCACYSRFSSRSQKETSIERQYESHVAYVEQHDMTMLPGEHHFTDLGLSGKDRKNRLGLAAMLEMAKTGAFKYLLIESMDRLSRRIADVINIYEELKEAGVEIIQTGSTSGTVDDFTAVVHGLLAQDQRRKILSITLAGRKQAAGDGGNMSRVPYGYVKGVERGELTIQEPQADVVRRIFRLLHAGVSPFNVARLLNSEGVPAPHGLYWYSCTIYRHPFGGIVRNSKYCGVNIYNKTQTATGRAHRMGRIAKPRKLWATANCDHWRIVDPLVWIVVNRRLSAAAAKDRTTERERPSRKSVSIFDGRYVCSCGGRMTGRFRKSSRIRQLACANALSGIGCNQSRFTSLPWIEYELLSEIEERIVCPEAVALFRSEYAAETKRIREQDLSEGAALRERIDRLTAWLSKSMFDGVTRGLATEDIVRQREAWTLERRTCRQKLASLASKPIPAIPDAEAFAFLRTQIASLKNNLPMKDETEAEMALVASLRQLVSRIVFQRRAEEKHYTLTITSALAGEGTGSTTSQRRCVPPRSTQPSRAAAKTTALEVARSGRFALTDADWLLVGPLLWGRGPADKRAAMDTALLQLRTGLPMSALPGPYGGYAAARVVRRLARDGSLRAAFEVLIAAASPTMAGLTTDAVDVFGTPVQSEENVGG